MNYKYLGVLLFFLLITHLGKAQEGTILESLALESEILGKDVAYSIYLPKGYNSSERSYPVLYLLHGFTDDETGWIQFGEVKNIADRAIQSVEVTPMIIVMPDAGLTWYVNNHDGSVMYENFFFKEFLPYVENKFRIRAEKQFRAIAGLSMGGYGSLIYSMKNPDKFAAAAPLSAGVSTDSSIVNMPMENWNNVYGLPFGKDREGVGRLTDHYLQNSILNIVRTGNAEVLKKVSYYIDCGDDDFLIKGNMELHAALLDKGIPHEFRVRDGGHTWNYWRTALPDVFKFVSMSFHR
jgi:S-formylglutathione hydrolase FrmB